jgi:hypothetical protein
MPSKPSTTSKKTHSASVDETFVMSVLYKKVQEMSLKLSQHCLKNVPQELPEDRDKVNKMYEFVRDGYIELSRVRELVGTTLREFGEVMRRLAESRAKANACAEVEAEPPAHENVLNEESQAEVESDADADADADAGADADASTSAPLSSFFGVVFFFCGFVAAAAAAFSSFAFWAFASFSSFAFWAFASFSSFVSFAFWAFASFSSFVSFASPSFAFWAFPFPPFSNSFIACISSSNSFISVNILDFNSSSLFPVSFLNTLNIASIYRFLHSFLIIAFQFFSLSSFFALSLSFTLFFLFTPISTAMPAEYLILRKMPSPAYSPLFLLHHNS